jgi:phosphoenolpyruvate carboxylase
VSLINPDVTPEKDFPLRDDIRLLGRLLGDTIRLVAWMSELVTGIG